MSHLSSAPSTSPSASPDGPGPSEPWRSIVSVLIFIHLFCAAVTMSANYGRSALQSRLLLVLAPYTQLVHTDLGYAQFQLTDGFPDNDYWLEIEPVAPASAGAAQPAVHRLPDGGVPGLPSRMRMQLTARRMAVYAAEEGTATLVAEMARSIGGQWMAEHGGTNVVVRVRRRETQSMTPLERQPPMPLDPLDPRYEATVYEADVFRSEDGEVNVTKREGRGSSAPVSGS